METPLGDVTYLAYQAIRDDDLILEKYTDPESVLEYLQQGGHFKTLSEQLKKTMTAAGICKKGADTAAFVEALYSRLTAQDESIGRTEKRPRNNVRRWLNGQFAYIRQRKDLIEICFALGLTLSQATELLNKCGMSGLNVRRAEDAVYLYCLLAARPYSAALALLEAYDSTITVEDTANEPSREAEHSGQTTVLLEESLMNHGQWTSDEAFLSTFLLPNRSRFIAYSVTAWQEYHRLKNRLYCIAVGKWLREEAPAVREKLTDDRKREKYFQKYGERLPAAVPYTEVSVTFGLKSALLKYADHGPFWRQLADSLCLGLSGEGRPEDNAPEVFDTFSRQVTNLLENSALQEASSTFLSDILSADKVLFQLLPSIIGGNDSRKRAYGDSSLKDTVLRKFPHRQTFTDFERSPGDITQEPAVRKAIVLMYYISYAYEYRRYLDDFTYQSPLFGEMGFAEFMEGLNSVLKKCRLSSLYPANQFDWLILRSIREFEIADPEEDGDSPVAFLNDVLEFSFAEDE